jgi:flagellar biogenesis protein FliO
LAASTLVPVSASAEQAAPAPEAPAPAAPAPAAPASAAPASAAPASAAPASAALDAIDPGHEVAPAASAATPLKLRGPGSLTLGNPGPSSSSSWLGNGLLVALLAGGGFWAWKRRNATPARALGSTAPLRVVGRLALGGRGEAVVIEIEGRKMLLGVTPHTVQHLADLGDESPAPALEMIEGRPAFADMLRAARAAKAVELRERGEAVRPEVDERPKTAAERRRSASLPAASEPDDEPAESRPLERQVLGLRRKGQDKGP